MATKSILKNINIKKHDDVLRLVNALEQAEKFQGESVVMSRSVNKVRRGHIKEFFSKVKA